MHNRSNWLKKCLALFSAAGLLISGMPVTAAASESTGEVTEASESKAEETEATADSTTEVTEAASESTAAETEAAIITGFADFDISSHYLHIDRDDRMTEQEIAEFMPDTLEVYVDGTDEAIEIPVGWYCITNDYETTEAYYVQFSPVLDETAYVLADDLDLWRDAPYIGVFLEDPRQEAMGVNSSGYWIEDGGLTRKALQNVDFVANSSGGNDQEIFTWLTGTMELSPAAAIGVLANIWSESGCLPDNLQNTANTYLELTDEEFTAQVDDGTITKEQFIDQSHEYYPLSTSGYGYGLCQWTWWSVKQELYEYTIETCGVSIANLTAQLEVLGSEIAANSTLTSDLAACENTADGAYTAADSFCTNFERPGNLETEVVTRGNLAKDQLWPYYESGYFTAGVSPTFDVSTFTGDTEDALTPETVTEDGSAARGLYTVKVNSSLTIRSTASTSGQSLGSLSNGTLVYADQIENNWGYITYGSISGWISLDYAVYDNTLRVAGSNRYNTAIETAKKYMALKGITSLSTVVVAYAENFPDALAGIPLAYQYHAPVLLLGKSSTGNSSTISFLKTYLKSGGTVLILGGTGVISSSLETTIRSAGYTVQRISGTDRYATNLAVVEQMAVTEGTNIFVVSGTGYADALSVSAIAAAENMPIFLTSSTGLTDEAISQIQTINPGKIYVIGGTSAISDDVLRQLKSACLSASVIRLAGATRYTTATTLAEHFGLTSAGAVVAASGENFPDGLVSGVLAAELNSPLLLVSSADYTTADEYLNSAYDGSLVVMGGTAAVSDTIVNALQ